MQNSVVNRSGMQICACINTNLRIFKIIGIMINRVYEKGKCIVGTGNNQKVTSAP